MGSASTGLAIGLMALAFAACGSDKEPETIGSDTTFAAIDTVVANPGTSPVDTAITPAAVDTPGTAVAAVPPEKTPPVTTDPPKSDPPASQPPPKTPAPREVVPTPPAKPKPTPAPTPPKAPEPPPPPAPKPPPVLTPNENPGNASSDPKSIFRSQNCAGSCHTITAQGISGEGEVDLSTVGSRRSYDWIIKFLNKQETIEGKKHKKSWKGSDEEQKTIARWLSGLK